MSSKSKIALISFMLGIASSAFAAGDTSILKGTYGVHNSHAADLYIPKSNPKGLMIWLHGGSWYSGDKSDGIQKIVKKLEPHGIAVLAMNYRLGPDGAYPRSVYDVQAVLSAIEQGACTTCQGDIWHVANQYAKSGGIVVTGFSAGGYLAIMGGMNHLQSTAKSYLRCINNVAGPVDLSLYSGVNDAQKYAVTVLSDGHPTADILAKISPLTYLESGAWNAVAPRVKWFLNYNKKDALVEIGRTTGFTAALQATGAPGSVNLADEAKGPGHKLSEATALKFITEPAINCFQ